MSYTIKWNSKPLKFIEKLPKEISARIVEKLEKIQMIHFDILSITKAPMFTS